MINKKLANLSQEEFKEQIIKPQYITCNNDTIHLLTAYSYYLKKYNVDLLEDLQGCEPRKQEKIIKRFIKVYKT